MISSECSQQCVYAYNKADGVIGVIWRTISYKERKIMLIL